ncbi:MAG: hypothetical protein RLY16_1106 [Bacteroidota bacterium]
MKKYFSLAIFLSLSTYLFAQNVGIGTTTPRYPLSFPPTLGQKLTLWDDGNASGNNYGIGVQSGQLQIHAYTNIDDIIFGYGKSTALTERMRIINSGSDGLDLRGRITLRNGTSPINETSGPGIWLYKANNSGLIGFIGTKDNQHIGFYGGPAGWGFTYDGINSRLGINTPITLNGNAGTTGQVLQSNGTGGGVSWGSGTNLLFNLTNSYDLTNDVSMPSTDDFELPGLDQTINLPYNCKVIVTYEIGGINEGCFACPDVEIHTYLMIDEAYKLFNSIICSNVANQNTFHVAGGTKVFYLPAGLHRFRTYARRWSSSGGLIKLTSGALAEGTFMTIIAIPQ